MSVIRINSDDSIEITTGPVPSAPSVPGPVIYGPTGLPVSSQASASASSTVDNSSANASAAASAATMPAAEPDAAAPVAGTPSRSRTTQRLTPHPHPTQPLTPPVSTPASAATPASSVSPSGRGFSISPRVGWAAAATAAIAVIALSSCRKIEPGTDAFLSGPNGETTIKAAPATRFVPVNPFGTVETIKTGLQQVEVPVEKHIFRNLEPLLAASIIVSYVRNSTAREAFNDRFGTQEHFEEILKTEVNKALVSELAKVADTSDLQTKQDKIFENVETKVRYALVKDTANRIYQEAVEAVSAPRSPQSPAPAPVPGRVKLLQLAESKLGLRIEDIAPAAITPNTLATTRIESGYGRTQKNLDKVATETREKYDIQTELYKSKHATDGVVYEAAKLGAEGQEKLRVDKRKSAYITSLTKNPLSGNLSAVPQNVTATATVKVGAPATP